MTVTPVLHEPGRYRVTSETDDGEWLVDLFPGPGQPRCACAIEHNRTPDSWTCKHVRFVLSSLPKCWNCRAPAGTNQQCPVCSRIGKLL